MKNGKIDKYLFEGGYAQATSTGAYTDSFAFNYYNQDHLGNNREVVDASGSIVQVTNYYPFGTPYADASASQNPNRQQYKYNGQGSCQRAERKLVFSFPSTAEAQPKVKELDTMHGLNSYDYGARQDDPILGRWDKIDPLCEKYYNVTPYSYCNGDPVNRFDPDGKEVRDGLGAYCADNHRLKSLVQNLVKQNDPNSIVIVAHGIYDKETSICASSINIKTYNPNNKEWEDNYIETGKQLANFLSVNSKVWNNYKNGSIEAKDLHIVFYACGSSSIVKEISKDEAFKDITFIAPNKSLYVGKDGYSTSIANVYKNSNGKITYIDKGEWHTIKNGQEPLINGNYNEDEKPGTKDFDYEWSPLF